MASTKHIYLIRHGETDYNRKGIIQGRGVDTSLNEVGISQAEAFYQSYRKVNFNRIFVSALQRTEQTVAPFIRLGIPWERWPELDELHWGSHEGRPTDPAMRALYREALEAWRTGNFDHRMIDGESINEVVERQSRFVQHLASLEAGNYLVCSHGRAMRSLLCLLTGTPLTQMDDFPHRNVCVYRLAYHAHNWEVLDFNRTDHLDMIRS